MKKQHVLVKRMQKPTPLFFKKLRNRGIAVAGISAGVLAAPATLPIILVKIAAYLTVAGGVITAVSQTAVKMERR